MERKQHFIEMDKMTSDIVLRTIYFSSCGSGSDKSLNVVTVWKSATNTTETWFEVLDHYESTRLGDLISAVEFYNTLP